MRQLKEYSKMAFRNIIGNKMRSLLTMLGIIIGIAAVIIVLCIGGGGKKKIEEQLSGIATGSAYIYVWGDNATDSDRFTLSDLKTIQETPGVAAATMLINGGGKARGSRDEIDASIQTGNADIFSVIPFTLQQGRFWNEGDYAAGRRVCVIDADGAKGLFGSDNVLGMTFNLNLYGRNTELTIVGITKTTGMSISKDPRVSIVMPASTAGNLTDSMAPPFDNLVFLAEDTNNSLPLANQIVSGLEMRHNNGGRDMYYIEDVNQFMDQFNTIISLFTTVIAAIAGISLLVGGIGVMNIMLVSVTERTREIGIRKALGAKTSTILFQFLIESATLTFVGGLMGIFFGILGGNLIGKAMDMDATIGLDLVLYIVLFSSVIGIFFGIYPARKAARLHPIEALRSD